MKSKYLSDYLLTLKLRDTFLKFAYEHFWIH